MKRRKIIFLSQVSHSSFSFKFPIQVSRSSFTFKLHIQVSHSSFSFKLLIQVSHSNFSFKFLVQISLKIEKSQFFHFKSVKIWLFKRNFPGKKEEIKDKKHKNAVKITKTKIIAMTLRCEWWKLRLLFDPLRSHQKAVRDYWEEEKNKLLSTCGRRKVYDELLVSFARWWENLFSLINEIIELSARNFNSKQVFSINEFANICRRWGFVELVTLSMPILNISRC